MRQAECDRCRRRAWVNTATMSGVMVGEFCGDCFDRIHHDEPDRHPWCLGSGPNHNDPGFDDVVRALEEDR